MWDIGASSNVYFFAELAFEILEFQNNFSLAISIFIFRKSVLIISLVFLGTYRTTVP